MRITESKLRRIIREELLREARWRPEDLLEGMVVEITINDRPGALNIWVTAPDGSGGHAGWIEATQRNLAVSRGLRGRLVQIDSQWPGSSAL